LDNEPGIGGGKRHADGVDAFMGTPASRLVLLPRHDPASRGVVGTSPGDRLAADLAAMLADWKALNGHGASLPAVDL
jgi:hypothetical protein